MTIKAREEIKALINKEVLEDIYSIVKLYKTYDEIFDYIVNKMSDTEIVKANKYGILVMVALNSLSFEEFEKRVAI